ncbi:MAG: serine protein kinase PrkA [Desulfobacteraceae bacterium]|nr:MAG: serine protein kinase PrkA [Desulfobacteraceae bacterium]
MEAIQHALKNLEESANDWDQSTPIPYARFLDRLAEDPAIVIRNVFQVFHDMIKTYVGEGVDEYPDDPESIKYVSYDSSRLFIEGSDHPFFADRLFSNRLINHAEALRQGAQQNKIYIFEGPPGSGKSTFLNNLLKKFEEYANTEAGCRFETLWRLNRKILGRFNENATLSVFEKLLKLQNEASREQFEIMQAKKALLSAEDCVEVPCPSHDNPILLIPKQRRRAFLDELLGNTEFKWKLFTEKEYEWVFRDTCCTICSSLYGALLRTLKNPLMVFEMVYAKPYAFNRRLGEGISVYNPGDKPVRKSVFTNDILQVRINQLLKDSNQVRYLFSPYAKTNNGIYALMDIKTHNTERLNELHNIISESIHKVEDIEENVNSLFLALINPEDKDRIRDIQSFSDRIEYINIPYVMDLNTEVEIYRNIFGKHIDDSFLPRVLHNFARVIISSRLNLRSEPLLKWIGDPAKYLMYCDENLHLLKMEIYTGHIPDWLTEEDRKRFTAKRRRRIISESEAEGMKGISGRDAIKIFSEFYSTYGKQDNLITMLNLCSFFTKTKKKLMDLIPAGFMDSLLRMYDYTILQEVKESLYYYNEKRISEDIQNYLFAINFEPGSTETCSYTGEKLEISETYLEGVETRILGARNEKNHRLLFRKDLQREYTAKTLTQEILVEGKPITETRIFGTLHERYVYNLKENVLDPFLENENFRQAIKEYGTDVFKAFDKKIRSDVSNLIKNLCAKYGYTEPGAKEVCVYVIDNDLPRKFRPAN